MSNCKDGYRICDTCGCSYLNFCLNCAKQGQEERVWSLLDEFGLNEKHLIKVLSDQVDDGSFPALNLAIALRDMKPAKRLEVTDTESDKLRGSKERLSNFLSKLSTGQRKE